MTYTKERDEFLCAAQKSGIKYEDALLILRHTQTLKRLAERECNGDDELQGNMVVCPEAKTQFACHGSGSAGEPNWDKVTGGPTGPVEGALCTNGVAHPMRCVRCGGKDFEHYHVSPSSLRIERVEARVKAILLAYKVPSVDFSGDPRGAVVKIKLKNHRGNDWGGSGLYCVPTRY